MGDREHLTYGRRPFLWVVLDSPAFNATAEEIVHDRVAIHFFRPEQLP